MKLKPIPSWLKDTLDRAWRTWTATFLAVVGPLSGVKITDLAAGGVRLQDVLWLEAANVSTSATIFTLLIAITAVKLPIGTQGTAALVKLDTTSSK